MSFGKPDGLKARQGRNVSKNPSEKVGARTRRNLAIILETTRREKRGGLRTKRGSSPTTLGVRLGGEERATLRRSETVGVMARKEKPKTKRRSPSQDIEGPNVTDWGDIF